MRLGVGVLQRPVPVARHPVLGHEVAEVLSIKLGGFDVQGPSAPDLWPFQRMGAG